MPNITSDQIALDRSLADAQKIARRLSQTRPGSAAHSAAVRFCQELRKLGAKDEQS